MGALDDAAALIRQRLRDLDAEERRLWKALHELDGGRSAQAQPQRSSPGRRRARKRGSGAGSTRKGEVLAQVKARPQIRTGEIAKALKIAPTQVSNLLSALKKEGALKKDGRSKKWVVAG